MLDSLRDWSQYLRRTASASLGPGRPWAEGTSEERGGWASRFRDGAGQRREVDGFLLARLSGTPLPAPSAESGPDVAAWRSVVDPLVWTGDSGEGPFAEHLKETSIEVWTECELCVLHARAWVDLQTGGLSARTLSAARWLIREIQPDNATTRPWGVGVFAWMGVRERDVEALMYAETLVHNTLVSGSGRTEPMSACILIDGAEWLEASEGR